MSIGLLLDNSGSMRPLRSRAEAAALDFVRASNPLDESFVVNFADKVRVDVEMTSDVATLEAGITRVDSIGARRCAMRSPQRRCICTIMRNTIGACSSSSPMAGTTPAL